MAKSDGREVIPILGSVLEIKQFRNCLASFSVDKVAFPEQPRVDLWTCQGVDDHLTIITALYLLRATCAY